MPWKDWFEKNELSKKWQLKREEHAKGEASRKKALAHRKKTLAQRSQIEKQQACEKLAYLLWEADGKPENCGDKYFLEAQKRLDGYRWQLYKLHQPFVLIEKKYIEPLDRWSDRANIFSFFTKISPIIEAIGVLAIPFVIFSFENRREQRQIEFEQNLIETQSQVRRQEAVRDYFAQMTTIYIEKAKELKARDEDLIKLVEATTLAVLNTLSVNEKIQLADRKKDEDEQKQTGTNPTKGQVINFLADLGWINASEEEEQLISLEDANLEDANLFRANLFRANLERADLEDVFFFRTILNGSNLEGANLKDADLEDANLEGANLKDANLTGAIFCRTTMPDGEINNRNCPK